MSDPTGVPIQPAATAVLVREHSGEVLLLLRHASHGFMANVWVFPGGRVDDADLSDQARQSGDGLPAAFLRAAVRETFEEAGILLIDPPRVVGSDEARDFAAVLASSRISRFSNLEPFARWVTPPNEKRRYDTLFFCGLVPDLDAKADLGEVVEARWLHPAAAIAEHRQGRLPLAPPTLLTLHALLAASYAPEDGYAPTRDSAVCWSPQHADRLMQWVRSVAADPVALCPSLSSRDGRLEVVAGPFAPWPVPEPLRHLAAIRLARGEQGAHWELVFGDGSDAALA